MELSHLSIFYSAQMRLLRAEEHLNDLESQIDQFFTEKPYAVVCEPDPDGIHEIHKLKFTQRFPFRWRILATEIIEHVRASLDHATFAAHLAAKGDPNSRYAAFPFGKSASDLDKSIRGRSKDLPAEIQTLLRSFNCHEGGNRPLYALNELCNLSKHTLITFMVGVAFDFEIRGTAAGWPPGDVAFPKELSWNRSKNEIEYARTKRGVQFEHQAKVNVFVALQEKEVTHTISAVAILNAMLEEARGVIMRLEYECMLLGYIVPRRN